MAMRGWRLGAVALMVVLALSGCVWGAEEPELSPQEVTTKFYHWYIGYPSNPLVERAYRESPYLAESFIEDVDEVLEDGVRADPILLAQDIPERFSVDEAEIAGDEATVTVSLYWSGNPNPSKREVDLRLIDGAWRITGTSIIDS